MEGVKNGPKIIVAQRTLRDVRDSKNYTIRKLADGNCWMTSGLKYSLSANSTRVGVNHSTNETFNFNTGAACGTDSNCIMNSNTVMTEFFTGGGYYYSWYAATAGTGTASMSSGDASGSICPKGWRLPANYTSIPTKSYGGLTEAYFGFHVDTHEDYTAVMVASPFNFVLGGFYYAGVRSVNETRMVSSTVNSGSNIYNLYLNSARLHPQGADAKYWGYSVRCANTDL